MALFAALPCQQYLIRHIKNNRDLLSFAKMFFSVCEDKGLDAGEAAFRYEAAFLSMRPDDKPDMFLFHDKRLSDEEFVLAVKSDPELPKIPACYDYCKDVLGSCELCKTCSCYKGYVNGTIDLQYSLIKYVVTSHDTFLSVKDDLYAPKNIFKGYVDLVKFSFDELYPLPVPILHYLYRAILACGSNLYSDGDMNSRLKNLKDKTLELLVKSSKSGKYDAVNAVPVDIMDKVWKHDICQCVLNATDMTLEGAQTFIESYSGRKRSKKTETVSSDLKGLPPIEDSLFSVGTGDARLLRKTGVDTASEGISEKVGGAEQTEQQTSVLGAESVSAVDTSASDSDDVRVAESADMPAPSSAENSEKAVDSLGDAAKEESSVAENAEPEVLDDVRVGVDDPLYLPTCTMIAFSNPREMKRDYLFSSFIPAEVFDDGRGGFCFVFLLRDNFYVCRPDSPKVKEIMGNKGVVKICWHPFDIYSLCTEHGISIKSLYSILEKELSFFSEGIGASYWAVCSKYVEDLPDCDFTDQRAIGMQYYKHIYTKQSGLTGTSLSSSGKLHTYFEVLGRSYHRSRSLKDSGHLFAMSSLGRIKFNCIHGFDVLRAGYEVSVVVEGLKDVVAAELFVTMLERFGTDRFRGLQLVSINNNILTLFVPGYMYEYVSSYIQIYLDKYAMRTGNMGMHVHFSSTYHDPSHPERVRYKPTLEPASLVDILDFLASRTEQPGEYRMSLDTVSAMICSRK